MNVHSMYTACGLVGAPLVRALNRSDPPVSILTLNLFSLSLLPRCVCYDFVSELARTLISLGKDDWPEIFHTLNSVRRLALHHATLVEGSVHEVLRDVLKQVSHKIGIQRFG